VPTGTNATVNVNYSVKGHGASDPAAGLSPESYRSRHEITVTVSIYFIVSWLVIMSNYWFMICTFAYFIIINIDFTLVTQDKFFYEMFRLCLENSI